MKVDAKLGPNPLPTISGDATQREQEGYAGVWSAESSHDPFLPLALAAEHTTRIELGTAIAVAFARTPMTVAHTSRDLHELSGGRFTLGLGSQVKAHVERRFSMPWGRPAARMREFVTALRAIWDSWENQTPLDFQGDFYQHSLMTPFFSPGPSGLRAPRVVLAAVGEAMCEVAGEVCDGIFLHGFTTQRYLAEVTLPAVARGAERAGRPAADIEVYGLPLTASGRTAEELSHATAKVRQQIAFYASTPAYRKVLELHGWQDLGIELHQMSRTDDPERWARMGEAVPDEVLHAFAVVGEPDTIAASILDRCVGLMDRVQFYTPYETDPALWAGILTDIADRAP